MFKIIKRDGRKQKFNDLKIIQAVEGAFQDIDGEISDYASTKAKEIAKEAENFFKEKKSVTVEDIQDFIERKLMQSNRKDIAKQYILYRDERSRSRKIKEYLSEEYKHLNNFISGLDEESIKENSNKDTRIISTMRDYIAGFTCRDLATEVLLPKEISDAHKKGIIHFHDTDYSPVMPMYNCCLINLEDMLQNGTVISGTLIEKPHSFRTACTIATQISAQVASSQYGGQTINLAHLAPFVEESRKRYKKKWPELTDELIESMVKEEISDGVQTMNYQWNTLNSTNGQSPFISVFMYLGDAKNKQEEKDLALIIEEFLRQRIISVKNEQGVYVTIAFPKLLFVLDENNAYEGTEYWYLTKLAAECSAKRLVPDYISAKKMKELKQGDVFGCINKTCA